MSLNLPFGLNAKLVRLFGGDTTPVTGTNPNNRDIDPDNPNNRWSDFQKSMFIETDRKKRYAIYTAMDNTDIAAIVADQYADDASQPLSEGLSESKNQKILFQSNDPKIAGALKDMRVKLNLDELASPIIRAMGVMGDDFERTIYQRGKGVVGLSYTDPERIERVERRTGQLIGFKEDGVGYKTDNKSPVSWPWDYVHFRNLAKHRSSKYGTSIFHASARPWKQCQAIFSEVSTPNGQVYIQDLKVNDIVYSYDADKFKLVKTRVVACGKTGNKEVVKLTTDTGRTVTMTPDHPVLHAKKAEDWVLGDGFEYVDAEKATSLIVLPSTPDLPELYYMHERVVSCEPIGSQDVYDITVEHELHNFISNGVVVHNCVMATDEQLFYRINRRPARDVHFIDTGTNDPTEERKILKQYRDAYREKTTLNPTAGTMNYQFLPPAASDDMFLARRKDSTTEVIRQPGTSGAGDMEDIVFYLDSFFATVRMPKELFGYMGQNSAGIDIDRKKRFTSQNVVYARAIQRYQFSFTNGLRDLAEIHLALLSEDPEDITFDYRLEGKNFDVVMEASNYLAEYEKLDLLDLRYQLATTALNMFQPQGPDGATTVDSYEWTKWVMLNILKFTETQVDDLIDRSANVADGGAENVDLATLGSASPTATESQTKMIKAMIKQNPRLAIAINRLEEVRLNDSILTQRTGVPMGQLRKADPRSLSSLIEEDDG